MLILLCIYPFFEPYGIHSWTLSGVISRIAISLGSNRRLKQNEDPFEQELKCRLFWSIYNLDMLLSVSFGKLSTDEDNIDVPLPKYHNFKIILSMIRLRKIEGQIIKEFYSLKGTKETQN
ncbi:unnamed protein product [Penicillium nalgiovense]|nr:unnamed protein product [Penicillium nalgiovense]